MTAKLCPIMSRPYIHKFDNGGYQEEEERLIKVGCYGAECALWCAGECSFKVMGMRAP